MSKCHVFWTLISASLLYYGCLYKTQWERMWIFIWYFNELQVPFGINSWNIKYCFKICKYNKQDILFFKTWVVTKTSVILVNIRAWMGTLVPRYRVGYFQSHMVFDWNYNLSFFIFDQFFIGLWTVFIISFSQYLQCCMMISFNCYIFAILFDDIMLVILE